MRRRRWYLWAGGALLLAGAVVLGWNGWIWYQASQVEKHAKEWLGRRRVFHAPAPPPLPQARFPKLHRGDVVAELLIPRLGLSVVVLEGADEGILKLAAGHIPGTGLPWVGSNIGIAAHRDSYFRALSLIRPHDIIALRTRTGVSHFTVRDMEIVSPSNVQVLKPGRGHDLTLVTCYPFHYIGHAPKRFIVHAERGPV